jgi:hypothetical protein
MADNVAFTPGSGATGATDDIGGVHYPRVKLSLGADGTANDASAGAGAVGTGTQRVTLASDDPAVTALQILDNAISGSEMQVDVVAALPAGTNNIGDVDIASIAAGDNNIGNVDIVTVPSDPFGANADAASATGSISAKLRAIATALGTTALDLGVGTGGSRTLRVAIDSSQLEGAEYEFVAASSTSAALGATGATGDYLRIVRITPLTLSPGQVSLQDGSDTDRVIFQGGSNSVTTLHPFTVEVGAFSTSGAWKITTGANVTATGYGNFT